MRNTTQNLNIFHYRNDLSVMFSIMKSNALISNVNWRWQAKVQVYQILVIAHVKQRIQYSQFMIVAGGAGLQRFLRF